MLQPFLKVKWWVFRIAVALWFVAMLIIPLYGLLNPWPEAERALDAEGLHGTKLMVGAGGSSERENNNWSEAHERSYLIFPDSLRHAEIFIFEESKTSNITGIKHEVIHSRMAIPLLVLWVMAGWFTYKTVKLGAKQINNYFSGIRKLKV